MLIYMSERRLERGKKGQTTAQYVAMHHATEQEKNSLAYLIISVGSAVTEFAGTIQM